MTKCSWPARGRCVVWVRSRRFVTKGPIAYRIPMIRYSKQYWGFFELFAWYGSAFPRALPISLVSAAAAGLLFQYKPEGMHNIWKHPFTYQAFFSVVGLMIVFRCGAVATLPRLWIPSSRGAA
jgi:hypothetical protein